jgi:hypothetical protein
VSGPLDPDALAGRLAGFATLGLGVAHELAQPLNVIITNATMAGEDLARLRTRLASDDPLHAELDELAAAQTDILAAAERIAALAATLRALPRSD